MKATILSLLLLACALSAPAVERSELDSQIRILGTKLEALEAQPAKRIPEDILDRAQGILLLYRSKAGEASGGGSGVAMVKGPTSGVWSPVAFMAANAARLGLQPGTQPSLVVILLMDTNATRLLIDPTYEFGGQTPANGIAAVPPASGVVPTKQTILIFDDQQGFVGAAAAQNGAFLPIDEANRIYYGRELTARDILFDRQVAPTGASAELAGKVAGHSFLPHP